MKIIIIIIIRIIIIIIIINLTQTGTFYKFVILRPEDSTLVGAPLSRGSALESCLEYKISKLRSAISRLRLFPAQKALTILKSSFSTPRLMHVVRCSSCFGHHLLQEYDTVLREGLSAIVNIHMSDIHWLQACISVKSGGLGIRRAVSLALPAFLASAVATSDLQSAILSRGIQIIDKEVELSRSLWCSLTTTSTPVGPSNLTKSLGCPDGDA